MRFLPLVVSLGVLAPVFSIASSSPSVSLDSGTVINGITDPKNADVNAFLGIPFAVPPLGALRFLSPLAYNYQGDEVIDASEFGNVCYQPHLPDFSQPMSEDCLNLNVWVNKNNGGGDENDLVPVGIFVHGGSYETGSGSWYSGADLVEYLDGDAIIVTVNYRLNVFGFLGSDELRSLNVDGGDNSTGNAGIQDQRLAMQWVKENIAAFGGDPTRITIFGESAGAGSMSNHLTMKKSFEFFDQVILESGSLSQWGTQPMWVTQSVYEQLLDKTRCGDMGVQCLLSMTPDDLLKAATNRIYNSSSYLGFAPTADGVEIDSHPWIVVKNGAAKDVPILHGTNRDEGSLFAHLDKNCTESDLNKMWSSKFDEDKIEILRQIYLVDNAGTYPTDVEGTTLFYWAGIRSIGDVEFSCPAKFLSMSVESSDNDSFMYHFRYKTTDGDLVPHGAEINYVFHRALNRGNNEMVKDFMSTSWKNFFAHGNPNGEEDGEWVDWKKDSDSVLVVDVTNTVEQGLKKEECDFFIPGLDDVLEADFSQ